MKNKILFIGVCLFLFSAHCQQVEPQENEKKTYQELKKKEIQLHKALLDIDEKIQIQKLKKYEFYFLESYKKNEIKEIMSINNHKEIKKKEESQKKHKIWFEEAQKRTLKHTFAKDSLIAELFKNKKDLLNSIKEIRKKQESKTGLSQFKSYNGVNHNVYKVDLNKDSILIHWKDKTAEPYRSIENVKKHLDKQKHSVNLIVNAGMYEPNNSPKGLYIENGSKQKKLDDNLKYKGPLLNFYMYPNGVFFIEKSNKAKIVSTREYIKKYQSKDSTIYLATQSGPLLIGNGKYNPALNPNSKSKHIRNGVGINNKGDIIFITSVERTNFYDFAALFKEVYNCSNALYFDGAISKIYCNGCDNYRGGNLGPIISVIKKKKKKKK